MGSESDISNEKAIAFWDKAIIACLEETRKGLQEVSDDLAKIASTTTAPVKDGFLRAGINSTPVRLINDGGQALLKGSVEAAVSYALVQHEHDEFIHPRGGEDHYLTRPLAEKTPEYRSHLAESIKRGMLKARTAL